MLRDLALYIIKRGKDAALVSGEHELENQIFETEMRTETPTSKKGVKPHIS
jgi:hypothetical protein